MTKSNTEVNAGQELIQIGISERLKEMLDKKVITQSDYDKAFKDYELTATSDKTESVTIQKLSFRERTRKLEKLALEISDDSENNMIDLKSIIAESEYYSWINEGLNTAITAAGFESHEINIVKLFCIQTFEFNLNIYIEKTTFQRHVTANVLKFTSEINAFSILHQFIDSLRRVIDPKGKGTLNITDQQIKNYLDIFISE